MYLSCHCREAAVNFSEKYYSIKMTQNNQQTTMEILVEEANRLLAYRKEEDGIPTEEVYEVLEGADRTCAALLQYFGRHDVGEEDKKLLASTMGKLLRFINLIKQEVLPNYYRSTDHSCNKHFFNDPDATLVVYRADVFPDDDLMHRDALERVIHLLGLSSNEDCAGFIDNYLQCFPGEEEVYHDDLVQRVVENLVKRLSVVPDDLPTVSLLNNRYMETLQVLQKWCVLSAGQEVSNELERVLHMYANIKCKEDIKKILEKFQEENGPVVKIFVEEYLPHFPCMPDFIDVDLVQAVATHLENRIEAHDNSVKGYFRITTKYAEQVRRFREWTRMLTC